MQGIEAFDIDVSMITGTEELAYDLVICRRQIVAFLEVAFNWNMPIPVPNCPDVDLGPVVDRRNEGSRGICPRMA